MDYINAEVRNNEEVRRICEEYSGFPEPGVIFRDVTSILQDADGLNLAIDSMQSYLKDMDLDVIVGLESRGFMFGVPLAYNLHKAFVPVRKKGSFPVRRSPDIRSGVWKRGDRDP